MPADAGGTVVTLEDIRAAAARIGDAIVETPLLSDPLLDERLGGRLFIKAESLQRTGSFKIRGALNRIRLLSEAERRRGLIAYSSGNHAQAVAFAAQLTGSRATIVMPSDAPAVKLERTRLYGADVVLYDRESESREAIAERLREKHGYALIKPYDDPAIVAGQGTLGLEIARQLDALGLTPDALLVPCGGGGLIAGSATAVTTLCPAASVYSVEPEGFDDTARSLAAGERVANPQSAASICDALLAPEPGALTFAINQRLLAKGLTVREQEVRAAMRTAFRDLKLVLEPGGAVALAAVLAGKVPLSGRTVVAVASGGNVDPALYASILQER